MRAQHSPRFQPRVIAYDVTMHIRQCAQTHTANTGRVDPTVDEYTRARPWRLENLTDGRVQFVILYRAPVIGRRQIRQRRRQYSCTVGRAHIRRRERYSRRRFDCVREMRGCAHTMPACTYIDAHRRRAIVAANWPCPLKMSHLNVHCLTHTHKQVSTVRREQRRVTAKRGANTRT
jgi:hypothetical protein